MEKLRKRIQIHVSEELAAWLEGKAMEGYNKGALIRHILTEYAGREVNANAD